MNIEIIDCISDFTDDRGEVKTYIPVDPIAEINLIFTKKGNIRGFHHHPEYDEYMIINYGDGSITEYYQDGTSETINTPAGTVVRIPKNIPHSSEAITDYSFTNLLTKNWSNCTTPIVRMKDKP
jgi:oxalate decarboxylase/phosphoglucose isomerase-like protein (cupin superfamily)